MRLPPKKNRASGASATCPREFRRRVDRGGSGRAGERESGRRGEFESPTLSLSPSLGPLLLRSLALPLSRSPALPLPRSPALLISSTAIHHRAIIIVTKGRPKSIERCGMSSVVKTLPHRSGTAPEASANSAFIV